MPAVRDAQQEDDEGNKGKLFVLDLSFIGWELLCVIPFVAFWVIPYMNITCAGFYDRLAQKYAMENAPPVQPEPPESPVM